MSKDIINDKIKKYKFLIIIKTIIFFFIFILFLFYGFHLINFFTQDKSIVYILNIIIIIALLFSLIKNLHILIKIIIDRNDNPIYKAIIKHGKYENIYKEIIYEINNKPFFSTKDIIFTENWVLSSSLQEIEKFSDLVWVYESIHYAEDNLGDRSMTGFYLYFLFTTGKVMSTETCRNISFQEIKNKINNKLPWVIIGYNDKLKALWFENRLLFIELVEERKNNIIDNFSNSTISDILD